MTAPLPENVRYVTGKFICARGALRDGDPFEASRQLAAVGEDDLPPDVRPLFRELAIKRGNGAVLADVAPLVEKIAAQLEKGAPGA